MTQDDVIALIRELVQSGATELQLKVPSRPLLRQEGRLVPMKHPPLTPEGVHRFATLLLGVARVEIPLGQVRHREFAFGVQGLGRFHVAVYRQRGTLAISILRLALDVPSLQDLGLEPAVQEVLEGPGLTLFCGSSARTAAMACLIDCYNGAQRGLLVDIEDPVAFLHRDGTAIIAQRAVGTDVESLACGVYGAIRQRADVVAVGDVPDRQTAEAVLVAAEQGLTVLACVAAPDPSLAASWILRHYASDRDMDVKSRIKRLLRGVVCVSDASDAKYVTRRPGLRKAS